MQKHLTAPLILTLELSRESFAFFDSLRTQYFPQHRNLVPAHLTLFHKLPGEPYPSIGQLLAELCAGMTPLALEANDVVMLGRGVAFRVEAPALFQLHERLVREWADWLSPQDRQGFRPHVVVQNKVEGGEAKVLFQQLSASFRPFPVEAVGLHLWRYLGGPWEHAALFPFATAVSV